MNSFSEDNYVFPGLYIYLIYLKFVNPEFYKKIITKNATLDELASEFEKNFQNNLYLENNLYHFLHTEACLLNSYRNYFNMNIYGDNQIGRLLDSNGKIQFKSSLDSEELQNKLAEMINILPHHYSDLSLSHLINKIELTENFVSTDIEK